MTKKNIVAIVACLLFFLVWYPLMHRLGWIAPRPSGEAVVEESIEDGREESGAGDRLVQGESGDRATPDLPATKSVPPKHASAPRLADVQGLAGTVNGACRRAQPPEAVLPLLVPATTELSVDAERGGIANVRLSQYLTYSRDSQVTLGNWSFPFTGFFRAGSPGSDKVGPARVRQHSERRLTIEHELTEQSLNVVEEWSVEDEDTYRIAYRIRIRNAGDTALTIDDLAVGLGGMSEESSGPKAKLSRVGAIDLGIDIATDARRRPASFTAAKVGKLKPAEQREMESRPALWGAVHNKYFLFYLAADTVPFSGIVARTAELSTSDGHIEEWLYGCGLLPAFTLAAGEEAVFSFSGYAGPKEYRRLRALGNHVESVMRLDLFMVWRATWMGAISQTILKSLFWLRGIIDHPWGYGFAIIIITIVIKTLFWPLTHKSTVSMRRMQKLQPLIQEIRTKYKDDAQVMNRKVMELYREHKVNPLGGCLPIVFQIPVFFALFNTLRGAIELRQADFLWVADLSMPDTLGWTPFGLPIRPLAILMGLTMLLQQKLSPSTADPAQNRMMTFMSIFFMFIFYSMPAGLTLYWTVNQVLTMAQNLFTRYLENRGK